ncbi:MAG: GC-type dockerin domain-anchored protein [Phycisphaerales bacterium]|nr:GC-type dockerin domain-anchored protein [Phycisphaerales bacterium]
MKTIHTAAACVLSGVGAMCAGAPAIGQTVALSDNFDSGLSAVIAPGAAARTGVQGFAGLGPAGNQFGGQFLRSPTGNTVTVTLTDLPPHTGLSVLFLFAAIDSLDGTGASPPLGDFLSVSLDGALIFRESFANATANQVQSYVPPPGVQLARRIDLGFSGPGSYYTDSAYDLSADPVFHNRPHTASTAVVTFLIEGPGIQSLEDESWAMDNLRLVLEGTTPACGPADVGRQGGAHGADGLLDNNDFIVFIDLFFSQSPLADRGATGGVPGSDGAWDNNDFIVFIDQFFTGC